MFFVEAHYHRNPKRAIEQVKYIAHREEGLPEGERRELYGIGARYRACRGDEAKIRKLIREDSRGLKRPVYFRFILTVDNPTAERFARLEGRLAERVLRDAVQNTFRSAARGVQGVFAVHQHGGQDRPAHPHVHTLLSPRLENGAPTHIAPERIQRVKTKWEAEVLYALERQEKRIERAHEERTSEPTVPARILIADRVHASSPQKRRPRRFGGFMRAYVLGGELFRMMRRLPRFGRDRTAALARLDSFSRNPERAARRASFRLISDLMPAPMREAMWLARGVSGFGLRNR
jgi:hypothetical protein